MTSPIWPRHQLTCTSSLRKQAASTPFTLPKMHCVGFPSWRRWSSLMLRHGLTQEISLPCPATGQITWPGDSQSLLMQVKYPSSLWSPSRDVKNICFPEAPMASTWEVCRPESSTQCQCMKLSWACELLFNIKWPHHILQSDWLTSAPPLISGIFVCEKTVFWFKNTLFPF